MTAAILTGPVRKRFIHVGGDVIDMGVPGQPAIDFEDAADLITEWRAKAVLYRQSRVPGLTALRLARWCETDANELEDALDAAKRWRWCGSYPITNVGREAFKAALDDMKTERV